MLAVMAAIAISPHATCAFSPAAAIQSRSPTFRPASRTSPTTTELYAEQDAGVDRQPWDAFRFIRQSSRFIRPPNPFRTAGAAKVVKPGDVIWSAGDDKAVGPKMAWSPLDDVVMGGVSSSEFDNNTGMWGGTVSSSNSGGFVGIRTTPFDPPLDMTGCKGNDTSNFGRVALVKFKTIRIDDNVHLAMKSINQCPIKGFACLFVDLEFRFEDMPSKYSLAGIGAMAGSVLGRYSLNLKHRGMHERLGSRFEFFVILLYTIISPNFSFRKCSNLDNSVWSFLQSIFVEKIIWTGELCS